MEDQKICKCPGAEPASHIEAVYQCQMCGGFAKIHRDQDELLDNYDLWIAAMSMFLPSKKQDEFAKKLRNF